MQKFANVVITDSRFVDTVWLVLIENCSSLAMSIWRRRCCPAEDSWASQGHRDATVRYVLQLIGTARALIHSLRN